jgi:uncharacterized lipoprotein YajG
MATNFTGIGIELTGDVELGKLFDELQPKYQSQVINAGYRKAGKIILDEIKKNFSERFNTGGKWNLLKYFVVRSMRTKVGVRIGALEATGKDNKAYITRILEVGSYKAGNRGYKTRQNHVFHSTGVLKASNFFSDAVMATKDQAMESVNQSIVDAMNKCVAKWSRK